MQAESKNWSCRRVILNLLITGKNSLLPGWESYQPAVIASSANNVSVATGKSNICHMGWVTHEPFVLCLKTNKNSLGSMMHTEVKSFYQEPPFPMTRGGESKQLGPQPTIQCFFSQ